MKSVLQRAVAAVLALVAVSCQSSVAGPEGNDRSGVAAANSVAAATNRPPLLFLQAADSGSLTGSEETPLSRPFTIALGYAPDESGGGTPTAGGVPLGAGPAMAVQSETGEVLWQFFIDDNPPLVGGVTRQGALTDDLFIVPSPNRRVYGLDRATGDLRWMHEGVSGYTTGVRVVDDVAVVGAADGSVTGLDIATGAVRWVDASLGSSILRMGLGSGLAFASAGRIRAFDKEGQEVWGFGGAGWQEPIFTYAPTVYGGVLYANSVESGLYAVRFPF